MSAKLLPYGATDFESIIRNGYYYVDKTSYIPRMEACQQYFFFVRPRRFGKSLMIDMLAKYYDIYTADRFDDIFGELAIGKAPTRFKNSYLILRLSFAGVAGSSLDEIEVAFNRYCNIVFDAFAVRYSAFFSEEFVAEIKKIDHPVGKLTKICTALEFTGRKIYLLMDEYDNFANNILTNFGSHRYESVTHSTGFFRAFLDEVKKHTSTVIERIFLTGVSPVAMDDLTSGFNITANMSRDPEFNAMVGFTEDELRTMLDYYIAEGSITKHTTNELIAIMKPWYNNYCFNHYCLDEPSLYNSNMVLYFMDYYLRNKRIPDDMLTQSIRTDYSKLKFLIAIDKKFEANASVIQEIVNTGSTLCDIKTGFQVREITQIDNFKSMLYYLGMLSITGYRRGQSILSIPNQVVKEQIFDYMINIYRDVYDANFNIDKLTDCMRGMAYRGDWSTYFSYVSERLKEQSCIREFMDGEAHVKAFLLSYMGMNRYYNVYPEFEMNKGYSDFFMCPNLFHLPDIKYSYVIEVKYAKRDSSESELDTLQQEAIAQLTQYAQSSKVQESLGTTELLKVAVIYKGWELVRFFDVP